MNEMQKRVINITVVVTNYNTALLSMACVESILDRYPNVPMIIVDNGSSDGSRQYIMEVAHRTNVGIILNSYNTGHGPAMHAGICQAQTPYVLLIDSDCILFRSGLIEAMMEIVSDETYAVGQMQHVNRDGINVIHDAGNPYIHPFTMLIRKALYQQLPPFEYHGAPCISNMIAAGKAGYDLIDFPVDRYIYHRWRGTREGLNVNWAGKSKQQKKKGWFRWVRNIQKRD